MQPLPILFAEPPTDAEWGALRAAKEQLRTPVLIRPVPAVPGSPGRVLVIGDIEPNWVCDYAVVRGRSLAALRGALAWCLSDSEDARSVTAADSIAKMMGLPLGSVKELEPVQVDPPRVRFS